MDSQYPKGEGGLWMHDKKNDKHPDMRGHIYVSRDQLKLLLEMAKDNQANPDPEFKLKVDIAMWDRVAKDTGREYKYLSTEVYKPKPKQVEPQSDFGGMDDGLDEDIPF